MSADNHRPAQVKAPNPTTLLSRFKNTLPSRDSVAAHPSLKPVAHRLLDPQLWRLQHEAVARGVAIGIFWAFAIPLGQFVVATAHCIWWRANIPVAVGVTLATNPLTIGFWLWLAHSLGSWLLDAPDRPALTDSAGTAAWLASLGAPALLGMGIFALTGSIIGYLSVRLVWRLRIALKRRQRRKIRRGGSL